jgi:RNA polymerase sigma-70 factor, ECF subfamily
MLRSAIVAVTEPELLERLRRGDQAAFDAIFRAHYAQLVSVGESMLGDRGSAEEIAQDVMLELWKRREGLNVDSVRAYLIRATRNRALNQIRHDKVTRRAEPFAAREQSAPASAESDLADQEIVAAVKAAVQHLPERCREVFELSRVHGLKYSEIARTLEISVKTVEAQMGKALRILRERLADFLPDVEGL